MPEPVWIRLGPDEVAIAELVGRRRVDSCLAAESLDGHFPHDDGYETTVRQNQHACGGEIAVCKALGGWWEATAGKGSANAAADIRVGRKRVQARHSIYQGGFMCIYTEDEAELPFVFVVGELPRFRIVGWIKGTDAKVPIRWTDTNPRTGKPLRCACFVVEQVDMSFLTPLDRPEA